MNAVKTKLLQQKESEASKVPQSGQATQLQNLQGLKK